MDFSQLYNCLSPPTFAPNDRITAYPRTPTFRRAQASRLRVSAANLEQKRRCLPRIFKPFAYLSGGAFWCCDTRTVLRNEEVWTASESGGSPCSQADAPMMLANHRLANAPHDPISIQWERFP